jgi:serine/threonine protein phosphatase PrpC
VLRAFGVTSQGPVRPTNEDRFAIDDRLPLCVVADGMGGHNAGEIAAHMAVDAITDVCRAADLSWPFGFDPSLSSNGNLLRTAVYVANIQVLESALMVDELSGMGTTVVAALMERDRLAVAHVGDSRLYLFARGELRQLTQDDTWVGTMLACDPCADPVLLRHHPMRHALTNVVGTRQRTEVHVAEHSLGGGELLVLTTDGVHGVLEDRDIGRLLAAGNEPADMAESLVKAALSSGSLDDCTVVIAQYWPDQG